MTSYKPSLDAKVHLNFLNETFRPIHLSVPADLQPEGETAAGVQHVLPLLSGAAPLHTTSCLTGLKEGSFKEH